MTVYDSLRSMEEEIIKCMKCGNCQAVCPIYGETGAEAGVARGKVQLAKGILEGKLPITEGIAARFDLCLFCKSCQENCPCGVQVDRIILTARSVIAKQRGLPLLKNAIFQILKRHKLFEGGLKAGRHLQGLAFQKYSEDSFVSPRFPFGLATKRILQSLAAKTLKEQLQQVSTVPKPKARVAFFSGCMENYLYPDIGKAVVDVLLINNVEVVVPFWQHCCGLPAMIHGDMQTARALARDHLHKFSSLDVDAVITACPTCICALKHYYLELVDGEQGLTQKAKTLAERTYDISEYLVDILDYSRPCGPVTTRVTYHDPCHLVRGHRVVSQPRKILNDIPGAEFIEMKGAESCCGGAGSFCLTHYDLSLKINQRKVEAIRETNTNFVATACPACQMQLNDGLLQAASLQRSTHVVQLLAKAYAAELRAEKPF